MSASKEKGLEEEMRAKILVVEDDPTLLDTLEYNLTRQQYQVYTATDGVAALDVARQERPDLIVLDLMLPGLDGLEVCRILRQEMTVPILMLTARGEEVDKVVGLEVGADDYITKPFSMRELLARVKAQLRRVSFAQQEAPEAAGAPGSDRLVFGDLSIDMGRREATLKGESLRLKPKEYELLLFLARNRNMALSRDLILEQVWGWDYDGGTRTVDVHVRWLREKVEEDPANPARIVTVRGVGYRFEA
jgi:DNA-binding response OmpR family regulator